MGKLNELAKFLEPLRENPGFDFQVWCLSPHAYNEVQPATTVQSASMVLTAKMEKRE